MWGGVLSGGVVVLLAKKRVEMEEFLGFYFEFNYGKPKNKTLIN